MNTVVTKGRLEAVVTATGMQSEMGKLAGLLAEVTEAETPLQVQLDRLGKRLAAIAGAVVSLIFLLGMLRGDDLLQTALTAIALAVAAIPEGLPAVVTVTLALGMNRMAERHAIVKKLAAVETLGCTTVICSDKTGTLTLNQMTARRIYFLGRNFAMTGEGYGGAGRIKADDKQLLPDFSALGKSLILCVDARIQDGELFGDPTEGALLALAIKMAGVQSATDSWVARFPRSAEMPFDSSHKFMATFHLDEHDLQLWVKGAPEVLLSRANYWQDATGVKPLDDTTRAAFMAQNAAFAKNALRVLALASRTIATADFDPAADLLPWVNDLTLLGLVGIIDPPRPEAREAIRQCHAAGISVKMITGDQRLTAASLARELGLNGEVHEGSEIDGLTGAKLNSLVE